jgi:arylsulfatase
MKAYIKGNWKILRLPQPFGTGYWQLYDLEVDPGEINDVSDQHPEIRDELINEWLQYSKTNEVFDHKGHYDSLYIRSYGQ